MKVKLIFIAKKDYYYLWWAMIRHGVDRIMTMVKDFEMTRSQTCANGG